MPILLATLRLSVLVAGATIFAGCDRKGEAAQPDAQHPATAAAAQALPPGVATADASDHPQSSDVRPHAGDVYMGGRNAALTFNSADEVEWKEGNDNLICKYGFTDDGRLRIVRVEAGASKAVYLTVRKYELKWERDGPDQTFVSKAGLEQLRVREELVDTPAARFPEALDAAIKKGFDVNVALSGEPLLMRLAGYGEAEKLAIVLDKGGDVHTVTGTGGTPLHAAAGNGSVKAVQLLLDHGADVNKADSSGLTPLYSAARRGAPDAVRLLIAHGAKATVKDNYGGTPLHWLSGRLDDSSKLTPEEETRALTAMREVIAILVKEGVDVNGADQRGKTPVKAAQGNLCSRLIPLLKEFGAR